MREIKLILKRNGDGAIFEWNENFNIKNDDGGYEVLFYDDTIYNYKYSTLLKYFCTYTDDSKVILTPSDLLAIKNLVDTYYNNYEKFLYINAKYHKYYIYLERQGYPAYYFYKFTSEYYDNHVELYAKTKAGYEAGYYEEYFHDFEKDDIIDIESIEDNYDIDCYIYKYNTKEYDEYESYLPIGYLSF